MSPSMSYGIFNIFSFYWVNDGSGIQFYLRHLALSGKNHTWFNCQNMYPISLLSQPCFIFNMNWKIIYIFEIAFSDYITSYSIKLPHQKMTGNVPLQTITDYLIF